MKVRFSRSAVAVGIAVLPALVVLSFAGPRPALAAGIVGGGFPESCSESALTSALGGGGIVTFNCGTNPVTIVLTSRASINGSLIVDGGGLVTLSGGGANGLFDVGHGATLELRDISLTAGSDPVGDGGAVHNAGTLRLDGANISGSRAYAGGGIYNAKGIVDVSESTLADNAAGIGGGGGIYNDGGTVTIERSTLVGNRSDFNGGGIYTRSGSLAITNSTLSANTATVRGGGVYHAGQFSVTWTTFAGNRALFDAGGSIYSIGALTFGSDVFDGGYPRNCAGIGTFTSLGHSFSSDSSCSTGEPDDSVSTDPRVGHLQDNGGPTLTHGLRGDSPALDTGDPTSCPATDQRGVARPIDGNGDGTPGCDAGAYEAPPNTGPSAPGAPSLSSDSTSPNRGVFTLIWSPATDPQGDPLSYTLLHKQAGQTQYSEVAGGIETNAWTFTEDTPEASGVWTYVVRASDGAVSGPVSAESEAVTVTLDPLGMTIGIPGLRPRPPAH